MTASRFTIRHRPTPRLRAGTPPRALRVLQATRILLLALLAGLAFPFAASATNSQPVSPNIQLDIQSHASNGSDGYTDTVASDGSTYSYRYSGGKGGGGDVIFTTRGRVTVNVKLSDGASYSITDVTFADDAHDQLSWLSNASSSATAVIQDLNTETQTAQYKVEVRNDQTGATIPCDPMIINR